MLKDLQRFLVLLEAAIPPGEGQHHNFSIQEGKLFLFLMLGTTYLPIAFSKEDEEMSIEMLIEDIQTIKQAVLK